MRLQFLLCLLVLGVACFACEGDNPDTDPEPVDGIGSTVEGDPTPPTLTLVGMAPTGTVPPASPWYHPAVLATVLPPEFLLGTIPGDTRDYIALKLRVDGFDLTTLSDSEVNDRLVRPLAATWSRTGQEIVLFINPDLRSGAYPIRLALPTGQALEVKLDHTQRPRDAQPSFSFGPQVLPAEQEVVREALALAAGFMERRANIRVAGVEVLVTPVMEEIASEYARTRKAPADFSRQVAQRAAPVPVYKRLFLNTGSTWLQTKREDKILQLVHEYFHVIQHDLVGGNFLDADNRGGGPKWLLEGAAVVFTDNALTAAGGSLSSHASFVRNNVYGKSATGPLQQYETNAGLRSPPDGSGVAGGYARSMKAVDSLLVNHDLSDSMAFWRYQGQGLPWRDAFIAAFGETIEQFYARNP